VSTGASSTISSSSISSEVGSVVACCSAAWLISHGSLERVRQYCSVGSTVEEVIEPKTESVSLGSGTAEIRKLEGYDGLPTKADRVRSNVGLFACSKIDMAHVLYAHTRLLQLFRQNEVNSGIEINAEAVMYLPLNPCQATTFRKQEDNIPWFSMIQHYHTFMWDTEYKSVTERLCEYFYSNANMTVLSP